jgi:hypothetical protein
VCVYAAAAAGAASTVQRLQLVAQHLYSEFYYYTM